MKKQAYILFTAGTLLLAACDSTEPPIVNETDYSPVLNNVGTNVIVATYADLAVKADALHTAIMTLSADPTALNLESARTAWSAARSPWEQSEGFLFGPVDQEGLDPALDSWPVNVTDLENVLGSADAITESFLALQEGTLKGFHTIEFLLWGESSNKTVDEFTEREFEYLVAASGTLHNDAESLFTLWDPADGNYISNLLTAGNGSAIYVSQKSALEELTNALIIIADEVANGKINDPLVQEDVTLEESRFSNNSKQDFADNMRSILNIYTGTFNGAGTGEGLDDIISAEDPDLHAHILEDIEAAITAIESIPGTFTTAIFDHPAEVTAAQDAVRHVQEILEEEVLPLISNL